MARLPLAPTSTVLLVFRSCLLVLASLVIAIFSESAQGAEPSAFASSASTDEAIPEPDSGEAPNKNLLWDEALSLQWLPDGLLWRIPWANQREPRMYATVNNALRDTTIDTAIGGEFGLV